MNSVWSSTWRPIGVGLQASSIRVLRLLRSQESLWKTSGLKLQCLAQSRTLLLSHTKICTGIDKSRRVLTHSCIQTTYLRYAHTLPGVPSRSPKSGSRAKVTRAPRPKKFNFSAREIQLIFQGGLNREAGNRLLQILQEQRVSGTLDQEVDASEWDVFSALEWLRIKFPIDEDQAIIARLKREEQEDDLKAEKIRSYTPQLDASKTGLYGPSRFDELRRINKQKAAEKAAQLEKAIMEDPGTKEIQAHNSSGGALTTRKRPDWVVRYRAAATMRGKMPPSMSKFERLWPSVVVTLMVLGLSIVVSQIYVPPSRRARLWPDLPPAAATLIGILEINAAIFIAWKIPPLWAFMNRTFIVTAAYPYARGIIGGIVSHQTLSHLAMNMLFLWVAGTRLHDDVGRGVFLGILFSCGAAGMLASLSSSVLRNNLATSTLGASGAVLGIIATWCMLHANQTVKFPLLPEEFSKGIPIPAILIVLIAIDIAGVRKARFGLHGWARVDHASHLGGHATGILAALAIKHRARQAKEADVTKEKGTNLVSSLEKGQLG